MITEKTVMIMAFGAIQEQTYKFVIAVVLFEHRRTNFTLLEITLAKKISLYACFARRFSSDKKPTVLPVILPCAVRKLTQCFRNLDQTFDVLLPLTSS